MCLGRTPRFKICVACSPQNQSHTLKYMHRTTVIEEQDTSNEVVLDMSKPRLNTRDDGYRLLVVFTAAFAIRLVLHFTSMPELLASRIEVSTPISSFKRCVNDVSRLYQVTDCCSTRGILSLRSRDRSI